MGKILGNLAQRCVRRIILCGNLQEKRRTHPHMVWTDQQMASSRISWCRKWVLRSKQLEAADAKMPKAAVEKAIDRIRRQAAVFLHALTAKNGFDVNLSIPCLLGHLCMRVGR